MGSRNSVIVEDMKEEYCVQHLLNQISNEMYSNFTTDAVETVPPVCDTLSSASLTLQKVASVENALEYYEKVSLVFLLYNDAQVALQNLYLLQHGANKQVLLEWAQSEHKDLCWKSKFLEALCIIQNYTILRQLGYSKMECDLQYLPFNVNTSLDIPRVKKVLYRVCEDLTKQQRQNFLAAVKRDFEEKKLPYENYEDNYLELYFLYWIKINYISLRNLNNLIRVLKVMDNMDIICENMKTLMVTENAEFKNDFCMAYSSSYIASSSKEKVIDDAESPCSSFLNGLVNENSELSLASSSSSKQYDHVHCISKTIANERYEMNPDYPGICLIINQKYFYEEPDERWKHLVVTDRPLESRDGTEKDKESLKNTFKHFNYDVIERDNRTHEDIINDIKDVASKVKQHSSLVICILSHGIKGKVYGVNSVPVAVSKIQNIVCKKAYKNLAGKPKVVILQSCQGSECQKVDDEDDDNEQLGTDGPTAYGVPRTADVLIFWATVPGYGAIRDKKNGTWFIQSLCENIRNRGSEMHFADICTLVKKDVISKRWHTKAMVPYQESTLSKFLFLPPRK